MRKVNQLTPLKITQLNKVGRYADGLGPLSRGNQGRETSAGRSGT